MKYATSYWRILSPFFVSERHSMVQPWVNALGNQASTTARLPLKSDNLYVLPSLAAREKSGAGSPTLSSPARAPVARRVARRTRAERTRMRYLPLMPEERPTLEYMRSRDSRTGFQNGTVPLWPNVVPGWRLDTGNDPMRTGGPLPCS